MHKRLEIQPLSADAPIEFSQNNFGRPAVLMGEYGGGVRKGPRFLKGGTFEGRKAYSCLQFSDVGYIIKFVSLYFAKVNE